jgi:hypothetical protein
MEEDQIHIRLAESVAGGQRFLGRVHESEVHHLDPWGFEFGRDFAKIAV